MCALETPETSGAADRSLMSLSETSLGISPSSAPSSPTSQTLDVIRAFIAGTTCKELVHELGRKTATSTSQLLDIATNFASGEEAIGAILSDVNAKGK